MGSSFANVQVATRDLDASGLIDGIGECLRQTLEEDGFVPVEGEQPADRTIFVRGEGGWIGVYDQACDSVRSDVAERLAGALSSTLKTHALSVLIYDSDVLELRLFYLGAQIDRMNSNPSYFGRVSAAERKAARGQPEAWAPVLLTGEKPAALRGIWAKQKLFADDTLRETAVLLGLSADLACTTYRDIEPGDARFMRVAFRPLARPRQPPRAEGPPRFVAEGSSAKLVAAVNSPVVFSGSARNAGGSGRGLSVVVWGEAVTRGLLSIDAVQLALSFGDEAKQLTAPFMDAPGHEHRVRIATFSEVELAAAPAVEQSALSPDQLVALDERALMDMHETWERQTRESVRIHANITGTALAPGAGALHVGFVPDESSSRQSSVTIAVNVYERARRPLRAREAGPRLPEHVLFGLVSFELERMAAAQVSLAIIEPFLELLDASLPLSLTVFPAEARTRPRTSRTKVAGFSSSARWKKLAAELVSARCVTGEQNFEVKDFFDRRPTHGFAFGNSLYDLEVPNDPELPTLAVWVDLERASHEYARKAVSLLNELVAECMLQHAGVQAQVGRTTQMYHTLDMTVYESACEIQGQCTLRRSWLRRFLRGAYVGTLWLGEALVALLPDLKALQAAAPAEWANGRLKLAIDDEETLDAVERALAPLLASAEDWKEATQRMFANGTQSHQR
jgi:hypothetical protein